MTNGMIGANHSGLFETPRNTTDHQPSWENKLLDIYLDESRNMARCKKLKQEVTFSCMIVTHKVKTSMTCTSDRFSSNIVKICSIYHLHFFHRTLTMLALH